MTSLRRILAVSALATIALPGLALANDDRGWGADARFERLLIQQLGLWNDRPAHRVWRADDDHDARRWAQRHRGWDRDDDDDDRGRRGRDRDDDDDD